MNFPGAERWLYPPAGCSPISDTVKWAIFHEEFKFKRGVLVLYVRSFRTYADSFEEAAVWVSHSPEFMEWFTQGPTPGQPAATKQPWLILEVPYDFGGSEVGEVFLTCDGAGKYLLRRGDR